MAMNSNGGAVSTQTSCPTKRRVGKRGRRGKEGAKVYTGEGNPVRKLKDEQALATVLWAGLDSQYFSAILIPAPGSRSNI